MTSHAPLVTIAIPTYKRVEMLRGTIASVRNQTYGNIQIIVSNNACGDETAELIASLGDERIVYIENSSPDKDMVDNWNRPLLSAEGKYFVLLCDDDELNPEYVASMVEIFESREDAVIGVCDTEIIDEQGALCRVDAVGDLVSEDGRLFVSNWLSAVYHIPTTVTLFLRTRMLSEIGGYPRFPAGQHSPDAVLVALAHRGAVVACPRAKFRYRVYPTSYGLRLNHTLADAGPMFMDYYRSHGLHQVYNARVEKALILASINTYLNRSASISARQYRLGSVLKNLLTNSFTRDRRFRGDYFRLLPACLARIALRMGKGLINGGMRRGAKPALEETDS